MYITADEQKLYMLKTIISFTRMKNNSIRWPYTKFERLSLSGSRQYLQTVDKGGGISASLALVWLEVEGVQVFQVSKGKDAGECQQVVEHQNEQVVGCQQLQQ